MSCKSLQKIHCAFCVVNECSLSFSHTHIHTYIYIYIYAEYARDSHAHSRMMLLNSDVWSSQSKTTRSADVTHACMRVAERRAWNEWRLAKLLTGLKQRRKMFIELKANGEQFVGRLSLVKVVINITQSLVVKLVLCINTPWS